MALGFSLPLSSQALLPLSSTHPASFPPSPSRAQAHPTRLFSRPSFSPPTHHLQTYQRELDSSLYLSSFLLFRSFFIVPFPSLSHNNIHRPPLASSRETRLAHQRERRLSFLSSLPPSSGMGLEGWMDGWIQTWKGGGLRIGKEGETLERTSEEERREREHDGRPVWRIHPSIPPRSLLSSSLLFIISNMWREERPQPSLLVFRTRTSSIHRFPISPPSGSAPPLLLLLPL